MGNAAGPPVALLGARVFTGDHFLDDHAVLIDGGRIAGLLPRSAVPVPVGSPVWAMHPALPRWHTMPS